MPFILLSGSKLHCQLQLLLFHFLPFSQQRSDLGYAICLLEHFFLSPHLSPWLLQPFTVRHLYIFFPPHMYSKLLCSTSHFCLLQLATPLSTNFNFCLKYFLLPLESLSKFYTSIFNIMSIFTPCFTTSGFSRHFLKCAPPHTISLKNVQNANSSKNPSSLICDCFLNLTNKFNKTKRSPTSLWSADYTWTIQKNKRHSQLYLSPQYLWNNLFQIELLMHIIFLDRQPPRKDVLCPVKITSIWFCKLNK